MSDTALGKIKGYLRDYPSVKYKEEKEAILEA